MQERRVKIAYVKRFRVSGPPIGQWRRVLQETPLGTCVIGRRRPDVSLSRARLRDDDRDVRWRGGFLTGFKKSKPLYNTLGEAERFLSIYVICRANAHDISYCGTFSLDIRSDRDRAGKHAYNIIRKYWKRLTIYFHAVMIGIVRVVLGSRIRI